MNFLNVKLFQTLIITSFLFLVSACATKQNNFIPPTFSIENGIKADLNYNFITLAVQHKSTSVPITAVALEHHLRRQKTKQLLEAASNSALQIQETYNQDLLNTIEKTKWLDISTKEKVNKDMKVIKSFYEAYKERYQLYLLSMPIIHDDNVLYNYIDFSLYDRKNLGFKGGTLRLEKYQPVMRFRISEKYEIAGASVLDGIKKEGEWDELNGALIEKAIQETTKKALAKFIAYLENPSLINSKVKG